MPGFQPEDVESIADAFRRWRGESAFCVVLRDESFFVAVRGELYKVAARVRGKMVFAAKSEAAEQFVRSISS